MWCLPIYLSGQLTQKRIPFRHRRWDDNTVKLCTQVIPAFSKHLPLMLVVGPFKHNRQDLNAWRITSPRVFIGDLNQLLPPTAQPVHATDLLLDDC